MYDCAAGMATYPGKDDGDQSKGLLQDGSS